MTPSCERTARVGAYHDGELTAEEARQMEEHLRICPVCAQELEQLRSLSRFLAAAPTARIAPDAVERLHARVGVVRESVVIRLASALTAVAAAVLAVCTVWLWQAAGTYPETYSDQSLAWEDAARGQEFVAADDVQGQFGQWIVDDLTGENGNE
jgi:anti-sigma factor RsiW